MFANSDISDRWIVVYRNLEVWHYAVGQYGFYLQQQPSNGDMMYQGN